MVMIILLFFSFLAIDNAVAYDNWEKTPAPNNDDIPRTESIIIRSGPQEYALEMRGLVDGLMSRSPGGFDPPETGFQPNIYVRMENLGETTIINPWLIVDGRGRWRTLDELVAEATQGASSDAEKARLIYEFQSGKRFHWKQKGTDPFDAVKVMNIYGQTICGANARVMWDMFRAAGLQARPVLCRGHVVSEAYYDGGFHLFDSDTKSIFLLRDNESIASIEELMRDPDLVRRTHTRGPMSKESKTMSAIFASLFSDVDMQAAADAGWETFSEHTMDFSLRPGEYIEWRWDNIGKEHVLKPEFSLQGQALNILCNGRLVYQPDFSSKAWLGGAGELENIASTGAAICPRDPKEIAFVTWEIASAYAIVGGKIALTFEKSNITDILAIDFSVDGRKWKTLFSTRQRAGRFDKQISLDARLNVPRRKSLYKYFIRARLRAGGRSAESITLHKIEMRSDLQMSLYALPELHTGSNRITYIDESPGPREVRITHAWIDRLDWRPPSIPALLKPLDGTAQPGTEVEYEWEQAEAADGQKVGDYQIQVSRFSDMRYPLSPNFDRLVSRTSTGSSTSWTVPYPGLLNPETFYYWRIRARDQRGVFGPWSVVGSFTCRSPGIPLDVRAECDSNAGTVTLRWKPNPTGTRPVKYLVYASDIRGFTISDDDYDILIGKGFLTAESNDRDSTAGGEYRELQSILEEIQVPQSRVNGESSKNNQTITIHGNFFTSTDACAAQVVGVKLTDANANRVYYRVVAVDAEGNRSGPSEPAQAPHPLIFSLPPPTAVSCEPYAYQIKALRGLGTLGRRWIQGTSVMAFWDVDPPEYTLQQGPPWLQIDTENAKLHGIPGSSDVGTHKVVLKVTNKTGSESTQVFFIDVRPR